MVPRGALACCWYALIFAIACCIMDTAKAFVALHRPKNNDDNDHRWITPSKEKRVPARQGIRLRTGRSLLLSGEKHATKALARSPVVPSPREQHPERTPSKGGEVCPLRLSDDVFHTLQVGVFLSFKGEASATSSIAGSSDQAYIATVIPIHTLTVGSFEDRETKSPLKLHLLATCR